MTDRSDLRAETARLLVGATLVGERVYTPLDWDTFDGDLPVLIVRSPSEEKTSQGRASIGFTVVATIQITGRMEMLADSADLGALMAEEALERLEREILTAVINAPDLMAALQQIAWIRTRTKFSSEGEQHLAELVTEIGMEFYQGPEEFHPSPAMPLTDVVADLNPHFPGVRLDIQLPQT